MSGEHQPNAVAILLATLNRDNNQIADLRATVIERQAQLVDADEKLAKQRRDYEGEMDSLLDTIRQLKGNVASAIRIIRLAAQAARFYGWHDAQRFSDRGSIEAQVADWSDEFLDRVQVNETEVAASARPTWLPSAPKLRERIVEILHNCLGVSGRVPPTHGVVDCLMALIRHASIVGAELVDTDTVAWPEGPAGHWSSFPDVSTDRLLDGERLVLTQIAKATTWDGALASKHSRDLLHERGYLIRVGGWNSLSKAGLERAIAEGIIRS